MKLSVDSGNHGYNEECASVNQAVEMLKNIIDESVTEIKVMKKTASEEGGLSCSTGIF